MDRRVGTYLTAPSVAPSIANGASQSLLIVETRESFWLPLVIQNAVTEFPEWPLFVCAPLNVLEWLAPQFPAIRGIRLDLPPGSRASPETFSAIMFSEGIWNVFETEYVLVFQCDTVFAPRAASKIPCEYDYYGAACGDMTETKFVINGGLSLRRVSAFKKAITYLTDADRALPEDVAFCNVMRRVQGEFRLPSIRECMEFAIESFGDPSRVIGMHGTDKGYCPPALIAAMLPFQQKKRMIVDCFTYDGEPIMETRLKLLDSIVDRFIVVEALFTHSGEPKEPTYDPSKFEAWKDKIVYLVAEFGPMPEGYGADVPWIKENGEAWWRESSQRDWMMRGLHGIPDDAIMMVSDVDEIPDPSRIIDLDGSAAFPTDHAIHLDMAFMVHSPEWQKKEVWQRAFVATKGFMHDKSPTTVRCSTPTHVLPRAGWHCSSFFSVERHVQKIKSFAHREFGDQTDPETIARRFEEGKDPYGRGAEYDCVRSTEHAWLQFV
jgi:beta-1,4-mannosyl-glycoprotein beta-1,4-N-acetylglucosaminyltransferase